METPHRLAIARGRAGKDKFKLHLAAVEPTPFSMATLAKELDISAPTLRSHRLPKSDPNHRPIPQSRADRVADLTGWPADAAHWPAGLAAD